MLVVFKLAAPVILRLDPPVIPRLVTPVIPRLVTPVILRLAEESALFIRALNLANRDYLWQSILLSLTEANLLIASLA